MRYELFEGFKRHHKERTGRDVVFEKLDVGGGTSDMKRYIRSQYNVNPESAGIDLFFGGGPYPYLEFKGLGLLESYRAPDEILSNVASEISGMQLYDTEDFTWYSPTMAGFGVVYNKVILERLGLPEPRSWEDMAATSAFGWTGSGDPRKSGATHTTYEIILQAYGWEKGWRVITAIGANVRSFTSGSMQPTTDVAFGELAYSQAIDSYAKMQIVEHGGDRIGFIYPEGLTVINGDGIGILKGAPNLELAQRFIDFLLSPEGQRLFVLKKGAPGGPRKFDLGKFSVLPHLYEEEAESLSVDSNPFKWKSGFRYDADKGSARWGIVNDLIGTQIIDSRRPLVASWKAAMASDDFETEAARLSVMPITEAEAEELATSGQWKDAGFRNRTLGEWTRSAVEKYGGEPTWVRIARHLPACLAFLLGVWAFVHLWRRRAR